MTKLLFVCWMLGITLFSIVSHAIVQKESLMQEGKNIQRASIQEGFYIQEGTMAEAATLEAGRRIGEQVSNSDWMGPLAPVALSPFFGLACLSGIATYGPDWLQERSGLFHESSPLHNPILFWIMVTLTLVTSLPRLSKVSKPVAMAAEKLEAYSVAIIFLLMRLFSHASAENQGEAEVAIALAGFSVVQMPIDLLLGIAAGINILVINAIKLFIEMLVWLIPIPLIDACLEATNKVLCASLMSLYCYSPTIATFVNLMLLATCSLVFLWVVRRLNYYRHLIVGPILAWIWPARYGERENRFVAFFDHGYEGLPKLTRAEARYQSDGTWEIERKGWFRNQVLRFGLCAPKTESGILGQSLTLNDGKKPPLKVSFRRRVGSGLG